jgi:voltage-gated potassium channel
MARKITDEDKVEIALLKKGSKFENNVKGKVKKYFHLHLDNFGSTHGRRIEGTLFFLNFLAIVLFVIETHDISESLKSFIHWGELFLVSIFIVEYIARMWVAEKKFKHFFSPYSIIDLLSILPIMVNFVNLTFFRIFRILRLFRLLRVLRFQRIFKEKDTMFGRLSDTQLIVIRIVLTVFTIMFVSSGLIWAVESKVNPGYGNIWNAMYFSVVTLSTVGYGDITPLSPLGRVVTVAMILAGIAIIPWQLGKLVKVLFQSATKTTLKCSKCGLQEHEKMAKFCINCGKQLFYRNKMLQENSLD